MIFVHGLIKTRICMRERERERPIERKEIRERMRERERAGI